MSGGPHRWDLDMPNDPRLAELLSRWEALQEQGQDISLEELCRDCPELVGGLRRQVAAVREVSHWLSAARSLSTIDPPTRPTPADSVRPRILGRYQLEELLGQGGFGQVWRAFDPELQRAVAVKVPRPDRLASPPQRDA